MFKQVKTFWDHPNSIAAMNSFMSKHDVIDVKMQAVGNDIKYLVIYNYNEKGGKE